MDMEEQTCVCQQERGEGGGEGEGNGGPGAGVVRRGGTLATEVTVNNGGGSAERVM